MESLPRYTVKWKMQIIKDLYNKIQFALQIKLINVHIFVIEYEGHI